MYEQLYIDSEICIICLENIEVNTKFTNKICDSCDITVHKDCLNRWFKEKNKKICPICLYDIDNINDNFLSNNYVSLTIFKYSIFTLILICIYMFITRK